MLKTHLILQYLPSPLLSITLPYSPSLFWTARHDIMWLSRVDVEISDPDIYQVESVISAPTARYGEYRNSTAHLTGLTSTSYHIISYHIMSYHSVSHHIISCHTTTYHVISYHIISYYIISSYHIISYHITSCNLTSCHTTTYHITSCHAVSYLIAKTDQRHINFIFSHGIYPSYSSYHIP